MKRVFAMFVVLAGFGLSSAASAKDMFPVSGATKACEPCKAREKTPEEKCREKGGKWDDGVCVKTRIVKRRVVRRVETPAPPVDFEFQCYRRGGEWRNGLCYGKSAPPPVVVPPPAKSSVTVKQEQSVIVKNAPPPAAPKPVPPPAEKKAKKQWWWIGVGAWAMGLWAGEYDFVPGLHGTLVFAINNRFRVAGNIGVGYGPWQENGRLDVWFGGTFAVRAYRGLFVNFGVETMWGGFDGLSVHRRMFASSAGPEYWFGDRASVSLRVFVGLHDSVADCQIKSGTAVGGSLLAVAVYF